MRDRSNINPIHMDKFEKPDALSLSLSLSRRSIPRLVKTRAYMVNKIREMAHLAHAQAFNTACQAVSDVRIFVIPRACNSWSSFASEPSYPLLIRLTNTNET